MLDTLKVAGIQLAQRIGRFSPWRDDEKRLRQAEAVWFRGSIPRMAGKEMNQYRVVYAQPRPLITYAEDVTYTVDGIAWVRGCLHTRYSFYEGGLKQIFRKPGRANITYDRASILQSQTPCTYGDWVSEHVASISRAIVQRKLVEPLLIPVRWFEKPYVQRDLGLLGIQALPVTEPVRIKRATVINKTRNSHHWTQEEVSALVAAMKITPGPCRPGSALYLSRRGEKCEGLTRQMANAVTEAAMEACGVRVVRTAGRTLAEYKALASDAETVFGDHGSAFYNMPHWQTSRVVELHAPEYWDPSFLFFADSLGIRDYHVWQIDDGTTADNLARRIRELLNQSAGQAAEPPEKLVDTFGAVTAS